MSPSGSLCRSSALLGVALFMVFVGLAKPVSSGPNELAKEKNIENNEANSDLVFDDKSTLSTTNHDRISPLSSPPQDTPLTPSHWLSTTLHRVKRGLFDFFNNDNDDDNDNTSNEDEGDDSNTVTTTDSATTLGTTNRDGQSQRIRGDSQENEEDDLNHNGRSGGSQEEAEEDEDDLNSELEENDVGDDYDEFDKKRDDSAYATGTKNGDVHSGRPGLVNSDDEDLAGSGDIGGHSGSHSGGIPSSGNILFFRIIFTVMEPYHRVYGDRNSPEFKSLSRNITQSIQNIYDNLDGIQTATVVQISKREGEAFQSRVTLDLGTKGFYDQNKIKMILLDRIRDYHTLDGVIQVNDDDFQFIAFGENEPPLLPDCGTHELQCNNGECISGSARCNGVVECGDGSDEYGCDLIPSTHPTTVPHILHTTPITPSTGNYYPETPTFPTIPPSTHHTARPSGVIIDQSTWLPPTTQDGASSSTGASVSPLPVGRCRADDFIRCNNSLVTICEAQLCDGHEDCPGGGDEQNCDLANDCAIGELSCDIYRCIPNSQMCDGEKNCDDGTDELDCPAVCHSNQFTCDDKSCIENYKRCDNSADCPNAEDELYCSPKEYRCASDEIACGDGSCIRQSAKCDGIHDCRDHSDEKNCPCKPDQFACGNEFCISMKQRCDGVHNCQDASDEVGCKNTSACRGHEWRCLDGTCVDQLVVCNRHADCADGSDEARCCKADEFRCSNHTCLSPTMRCDGNADCPHSEDEENCVICKEHHFRCQNGECIDERNRCNGHADCSDNSDEDNCSGRKPTLRCQFGYWLCHDNRNCILPERRCDGVKYDCQDNSDEFNCEIGKIGAAHRPEAANISITAPHPQAHACAEDEFKCISDGKCIPQDQQCDDYEDCDDRSDEADCSPPSEDYRCLPDEFECRPDECIPLIRKCDGQIDCSNQLDEYDCTQVRPRCSSLQFQCRSDGACIPLHGRCDGTVQCRDQSDEHACGCRSDQFTCRTTSECISHLQRCDRRRDCRDGSDEESCPSQGGDYYPHPTTRPPPPPAHLTCPPGQQLCRSGGQCLPYAAWCDGRIDCNDLSDEENCVSGRDGLNLKTYPSSQEILERREVVFQCRDEGPIRARVHWTRANGLPLPPGSRDTGGRLEMPNIQVSDSGAYVCSALGYPQTTPGAMVRVNLTVDPYIPPTTRPLTACSLHEATCSNGDCISHEYVCDGKPDCSDGSDESRCNPYGCEPNEFRCRNKRCVAKTWQCDSENDCEDGSDEEGCDSQYHDPGASHCNVTYFSCHSGNECIRKSRHCDGQIDCKDTSDEIGCSKPVISKPPPPMAQLDIGALFEITCTVVGIPTPEIMWRLNWGHVPAKCSYVSLNGVGTLTCPNIEEKDQGAYSCEAMNIKGRTFAVPDTILVVNPRRTTCPRGSFNEEAVLPSDCLSCFCFGVTTDCRSADLFTYQLQPPFDSHNFVAVHVDPIIGIPDIRDTSSPQQVFRGSAPPRLIPLGRNSVQARYSPSGGPNDIVPYFAMPENHLGNQLKSYGGYIKYGLRVDGGGRRPINAPDVIISGNGYTLVHINPIHPSPSVNASLSVRFFHGEWLYRTETAPERLATREELMMTLADVRHILIRLQYNEGVVDTTLSNVEMDSAGVSNIGLGQANLVEECRCPVGYSGLSCENCGSGFSRHRSGPWLGQCFKEVEICPPGTYGDPSRGITCQTCPCPLTNPTNQFGRTCSLDPDGDVTCDCPPGYVGRRCEKCDYGYTGNPLISGDYCKIGSICNANGSVSNEVDQYGQCHCKDYADGPTCDHCKPNTFFLNRDNQFGCISCFCMGITQECTSSNYYRNSISTGFTNSINDFKLIRLEEKQSPISSGIRLEPQNREIIYSDFRQADTYYWSLPSRFLGDKITAYGGNLRYALRYVPIPGGQSSRNNAPDVELISENHINLLYFAREQSPAPDSIHSFVVPMLEQYWQRSDGQKADREHLLMALADLKAILIKASYTTNTREAALQTVSLDIAEERNTGSYERASAVEQCHCPSGYTGLSCEDCDAGYTRSTSGLYLGLCQPCFCNGHSNDCDPETGVCHNCRSHTSGESCDRCATGYVGDPTQQNPCRPGDNWPSHNQTNPMGECDCDPAGTQLNGCIAGECQCKTNVEGIRCDRCRDGTFDLDASLTEGCQSCFCSGIVTECRSSDLYVQQIPSQIIDEYNHGFTLTDQHHRQPISSHFQLNVAMNEIGYVFRPSNTDRLFWSLPPLFTGNRIKSYGGKLEFTQRFTERHDAQYNMDQDVIISGNGVTVFWTNTATTKANIANRISVPISTTAKWQRTTYHAGPRPASREDLMRVLANVDYILIRAKPSSDTASTFISDITLDTAVQTFTGQERATGVEVCRCSQGYQGSSCEQCKPGYYRDINDVSRGPLGTCTECPCSSNSQGCSLSPENEIDCICSPGWTGRLCENASSQPVYPGPIINDPNRPSQPAITITISSPPNLTIQSIGSTVRYTCSARSTNPNPVRLYWTRGNGDLPNRALDDRNGLLVITDLRVSDSGTYVCHATDGVSVNVKEVSLVVGSNEVEPPRVSIQPTYVQVHVGEPIDLTCSAVGNPTPYLQWNRKDGQPMNDRHKFHNGNFHIENALATDQGVYECTAQNEAGYDRLDTTVYVLSRPEPPVYPPSRPHGNEPRIEPQYHSGRPGDMITFRCFSPAEQQSSQIVWQRAESDGGQLPYSSRDDGRGQLQFRETRVEDSGTYECRIVDRSGNVGIGTAMLNITDGEGSPPSVTISPSDRSNVVAQGGSITLHCQVSGVPTPTIKWSRLGAPLSSQIIQTSTTLQLTNVQMTDRDVYVCVATNVHGYNQASTIVEVEPREVPIVEMHPPTPQTISEGGQTLLQCRLNAGIPNPTITWSRPGGKQLGPNVEEMQGGVLKISHISAADSGTYTCTAENSAGRATATGSIIVQTPPTITISPTGGVYHAAEGREVKIECNAYGVPDPTVQWNRYEGRDRLSYPIRSLSRSTHMAVLHITSATASDSGIYVCLANNAAGAAEDRVQLVVNGSYPQRGDITDEDSTGGENELHPIPQPGWGHTKDNQYRPALINEKITAPVGTRAELRCRISNDRGGDQLHINWERLDRQPLKGNHNVQNGVLYIDDVQPTDAGVYRCYGINTRTNRVEIDINADLEIITPPRIILRPQKQVVRPGDSATIECVASGDQPITISWEAVQRDMPRSVRVYNDALLQFHGIEVSDAGRYLCKARNNAGESDSVAEVIVQENAPPQSVTHTITAQTHEFHLTSGQSARLQCSVTDPSVGVHWRRESHQQLPRNSRVLGDGGEVLELMDVQPEDSGRYVCETTDQRNNADWIQVYVTNHRPTAHVLYPPNFPSNITVASHPHLIITPSQPQPSHLGDHIDVQCRSSEPGVITTWSKVRGGANSNHRTRDSNVEMHGGQLRIRDVRMENAGIWRCEARGYGGEVYGEDWTLDVIDSAEKETMPMDVKSVPKGSSIVLLCSSTLEPPVVFQWSRPGGGEIAPQINSHMNELKLHDVSAKDAGIYLCSATSNHRTINTPTVLVVTGILPYFSQAPISFISLPTISKAFNHFVIEVSIKPQSPDGLILYNGNNKNTDFISLALIDGRPEFKINIKRGLTTVSYPEELDIGKWHTIKIARNKKTITMYVNGRSPQTVLSNRYNTLDLNEPLYLAGHPALTTLTPVLNVAQGFVGCVSRLKVGSNTDYDLIADAYSREGVTTCEECSGGPSGNQCSNGGVCQEELSKEGFKCVCKEGYGGKRCERRRGDGDDDFCAPDICGPGGRCIEATPTSLTIQCQCPLGRVGPRCQNVIQITDPAFSGEPGAYIAYPTPGGQRQLKISLTAKPNTAESTGLLVYCAELEEGQGDFISLSLRDGHVELRFDVGSGTVTVRSPRPLTAGEWHAISATKTPNEARLTVDGRDVIPEKAAGIHRMLHLRTPLYVGGVDPELITINSNVGLGENDVFRGCVKNLTTSNMKLDMINSITDSSNVQECSYLDEINEDLDGGDDFGQSRRYNNLHNYYPTEYSEQNAVTYRTRETGCTSSPCRNDGQCYPLSPVEYRCNCIHGYSGDDCEIAPPLCQQLHPCQHNAPCTGNTTYYKCSCPLRYTGTNCEQSYELRTDVHLDGDGYLEMPSSLTSMSHTATSSSLSYDYENTRRSGETLIALEISTNATSGLLMWYGNKEGSRGGSRERNGGGSGELELAGSGGSGGDYIALQIIQGYVELSYDLGSGPAVILNDQIMVNDNNRHRVILKLHGRIGSLDVDDQIEKGLSEGSAKRLNVNGNIFLGGVPDYEAITHGRFHSGFNGCIHGFEINDSKQIEIGAQAINGSNVRPCSSFEGLSDNDIDLDDNYDDMVNK